MHLTEMILVLSLTGIPYQGLIAQAVVATVIEGTVKTKSPGAADYQPAPAGNIYAGELVIATGSGDAVIRCSRNQLEQVLPNDGVPRGISSLCPSS